MKTATRTYRLPAGLILLALVMTSACAPDTERMESTSAVAAGNEQVRNRGVDKDNWWDALPRPEWRKYRRIDQDVDWFEVYEVADGVYAIYEPGQFEEVISFLITGGDRALLFDTGLGIGDIRQVVEQLTGLDVVVLNSHTHYDHIGGNYQFATIYALNTPYTREHSRGSSTEAVAEFVGEGWIWKDVPDGFVADEYRTRPFTISRFVAEGDRIELGGRTLEILETPGHAPDSICLLDRERRQLFTGDTFYLAPLYAHLPASNFDDYARSAARLASLADEVDSLLTSHNVPIAAARYLTALGEAFADIRSGAATDYTITDGNREYRFDGFSVIVRADERAAMTPEGR